MNQKIFPSTTQKVSDHTDAKLNYKLRDKTVRCISAYQDGNEAILSDRIKKLNCEWDIERLVETKAASLALLGSILGFKRSRSCWFLLTGAVSVSLLQHALQGWCPSLPWIRQMGVRTAEEITNEKMVFKFLRGDFRKETDDVNELLEMVEKQ